MKKLKRNSGLLATGLCEPTFYSSFHAELARIFSPIFVSLLHTENEICIPYKRTVILL